MEFDFEEFEGKEKAVFIAAAEFVSTFYASTERWKYARTMHINAFTTYEDDELIHHVQVYYLYMPHDSAVPGVEDPGR